jgi:hypothetical protein
MRGVKWAAVLGGVYLLGLGGPVRAQDQVFYRDRAAKKDASPEGKIIEESPAGIKFKPKRGPVKIIPAGDIQQVVYKVNVVSKLDFKRPFGLESNALKETKTKARLKKLEIALARCRALDENEKMKSESAAARRYIKYQIAHLLALQARDDPTKVDEAIKALVAFKTDHPDGWQMVPALLTLGRLQEDSGKTDDARKTYEKLAGLSGVSKEIKQESEILVGRLLLRAGKPADAEKLLLKLSKNMVKGDPQRPFVIALLADSQMGQRKFAGVEAQLKEALKASTDGRLRGLVYNLLGDYYRGKNQQEDAFWSYLRVDAQYNEDPEQQAKALYWLRKLFDKPKNDLARAKECEMRLLGKTFDGTVYQRLAKNEKKK